MSGCLIILFIFTVALYAGLETGGYLLNRIRLRVRTQSRDASAHRLKRVLSDTHLFIFTVLIGQNIAVYMVSREVTTLYLGLERFETGQMLLGIVPWNAETAATLTLMLPLFLFGEVFPKNLFRRKADTLMYHASIFLHASWCIFYPVTFALKKCFIFLSGDQNGDDASGEASLSVQGLREFFTREKTGVTLNEHQFSMIDNLMFMNRVSVRQIMTGISSVVAISEKAPADQALELMRTRNVDQLAVYCGSVRQITGYLSLFDLIGKDVDRSGSVKSYMKKAVQISGHQSLTCAYRRLRLMPSIPLFVIDRPSRTIGRICLHDVAAYIVSENDGASPSVSV